MDVKGIGIPYNAATKFIDEKISFGLGEKTAIYYRDEQITYIELQKCVNKVGYALKELGIEAENRVLLVCYDSPEFITSFYGSIKIGAVPIPVNTMMKPGDYEYYLNKSRAKALIIHEDLWENISAFRDKFLYLQHVIIISDDREKLSGRDYQYWELIKSAPDNVKTSYTCGDDAAFWLFSSGSTGEAKGVIHLQHDMEYALNTYAQEVLQITEDDICFSASKLFFAYGLGGGMYFPLGAGASTVLLSERPLPEKVLSIIETYKPTIFFGVPTLYGSIMDYVERSGNQYDLSSLRICTSAGEALPEAFLKRWKELFGIDILDGIGSTEALHIYISNRIHDIRPGTSGKVVPGYEAKVVDEDGNEVGPNTVGDLLIKGDSLTPGYWNLHTLNKEKIIGEWFATGDKYYKDEDGYYTYYGRADDMLKIGGIWVSPVEVENCLVEHQAVLEIAVVGETTEEGLTLLKAYVVLKDGYSPCDELTNELVNYAKSKLARYKFPRVIEYIDELPKTSSGKIQRFRLRV
ncbi:benzoate-CoA ligase family protein [Domibacillus epiphyticus]|uniref:4-hydroxybenzoate--CoA ligase n=1 Tax=Domibacillus epiphyticus TaxID=1714355 RepID=A0A1V2A8K4_9BACI|nr:benzoate-CoA ligase family protein [Domibacillus epiphyticus]OMP67287.1 4-hydroxybenzoate--CoA ligase [Domibacillus epiphyticus]